MAKRKNTGKKTAKKNKKPWFSGLMSVDFPLMFTVLVLLVIGLTMLFSTSSAANMSSGDVYTPILKQAFISLAGLIGMLVAAAKLDYKWLRKFSVVIYVIIMVLMILVAFVGVDSHGARRQIALPFVGSLQPSEISKYAMIIWLAARYSMISKEEFRTWKEFFIHIGIMGAPVVVCIGLQRHASAAIVHMFVGVVMLIVMGVEWKKLLPTGFVGGLLMIAAIFLTDFRMDRILSFINRSADIQGDNWQATQAIYAVGSGGLFGLGLGNSRQKYSYLPEAENDYIFAIVGEELGFIGSVLVVLLFCIVIWRGITIATSCKDQFGTHLAFGITVLIGFQVLVNMGVVLRLLPATGMQLPLFSSGGSSMLMTLIGFGILLSISRQNSNRTE